MLRVCPECNKTEMVFREQIDYDCGGNKFFETFLDCPSCGHEIEPENFTKEDWKIYHSK